MYYINGKPVGGVVGPSKNCVKVNADGVKTYSALLDALYALIDGSKVSHNSVLVITDSTKRFCFRLMFNTPTHYMFSYIVESTETSSRTMDVKASGSTYLFCTINSTASHYEQTTSVPTADTVFTLYY